MNVRLVIDVPVAHLTALEAALDQRKLVLRPYIKSGLPRWIIDHRRIGDDGRPALPGNALMIPEAAQ